MTTMTAPAPSGNVRIRVREGALDALKAEHGIGSDAELAERLGISKPLVSQVRTGRRGVGPAFLAAALRAFGIPFDDSPGSFYVVEHLAEEASR